MHRLSCEQRKLHQEHTDAGDPAGARVAGAAVQAGAGANAPAAFTYVTLAASSAASIGSKAPSPVTRWRASPNT
eukprot:7603852-Prorocentrum_lima.AAC.1